MDRLLALRNEKFYDQLNIVNVIVSLFVVYLFSKVSFFVFRKVWKRPVDIESRITDYRSLGITKLNDSVYELYSPAPKKPTVEIIFFHGLQRGDYKNAFWSTWLSREGDVLWPKDWLSKNIPGARILSVSYDACDKVTARTGRLDMYLIGENFVRSLVLNDAAGVGRNCPVILVGHSLGGLVIKELIVSAWNTKNKLAIKPERVSDDLDRVEKFLTNVCGVFYYATPHGGSKLADLASMVLPKRSPLLHFLTVLNSETSRLNDDFTKWRQGYKLPTFAVAESFETQYGRFSATVVPEGSARHDCDDYVTVEADHINVCKPEDMLSTAYSTLPQFIVNNLPKEVKNSISQQAEAELLA